MERDGLDCDRLSSPFSSFLRHAAAAPTRAAAAFAPSPLVFAHAPRCSPIVFIPPSSRIPPASDSPLRTAHAPFLFPCLALALVLARIRAHLSCLVPYISDSGRALPLPLPYPIPTLPLHTHPLLLRRAGPRVYSSDRLDCRLTVVDTSIVNCAHTRYLSLTLLTPHRLTPDHDAPWTLIARDCLLSPCLVVSLSRR
ncbi:hypothetical protein DENSPDRAFT_845033 [Dentipellis sp. KUC8613]|nr:hypothetical protein DENSPDRAFT_845033 [Dentipellis sp. KUC8613]